MAVCGTQKERRNFRNSKNSREHKLKQKNDELDGHECKLESLKKEFAECLKKLTEYEQLNVFSRDDDGTIANVLIENKLFNKVVIHYEEYVKAEKESFSKLQDTFIYELIGEINENLINLSNLCKDIEYFYDSTDAEFLNEQKFRNKMIAKFSKLNDELSTLCPLIYGKNIESPLQIAIAFSRIYCLINLEQKRYEQIKQILKQHQHDSITIDSRFNCSQRLMIHSNSSKYQSTDLNEIEVEIKRLRRKKREAMKSLIERVYAKYNLCNKKFLKQLKLKQVDLHYQDSLIDDDRVSLRLQSELLQIQCEEFLNRLILLEKRKEMHEAKQSQLSNTIDLYLNNMNAYLSSSSTMSAKHIQRDAYNELKRLQRTETEQRKAINLSEKEIRKLDKMIYDEKQKQRTIAKQNRKKHKNLKRQKSLDADSDQHETKDVDDRQTNQTKTDENDDEELKQQIAALRAELGGLQTERISLEETWDKNNELIQEKQQRLNSLQNEITESQENKRELLKIMHQYENHVHSNQYHSENASRKNSEALEFIAEIDFRNKEYDIKFGQINHRYREKQTSLKNRFVTDYANKIKRNTKNRQTQIEQESYNIIMQRKDQELTYLTQTLHKELRPNLDIEQTSKFTNNTKPVQIKFAKNTIVAHNDYHHSNKENGSDAADIDGDVFVHDIIQPIKFVWDDDENKLREDDADDVNASEREEVDADYLREHDEVYTDDEDDVSTDLSFDQDDHDEENSKREHSEDCGNYKNLVQKVMNIMDKNEVKLYDVLNRHMQSDDNDVEVNEQTGLIMNDNREIESQCLSFESINFMHELLCHWTLNAQTNQNIVDNK